MASSPILVKYDHNLTLDDIVIPLFPTSTEEGGDTDNEVSMKKIYGVIAPLVKVNEEVIEYNNIISMELSCEKFLPTLTLSYIDKYNKTSYINTIESDNKVQIQIIPKFDGIYKKIKLPFFITSSELNPTTQKVTLTCDYYVEGLYDSQLKSYGKIDIYSLYNTAAGELNLGFCTNITSESTNDYRYMYLRNESLDKFLSKEFITGGKGGIVLDSWIDFYNNINLVDMYDIYYGGSNWSDQADGIKIWSSHNMNDTSSTSDADPYEIDAIITNNPKLATSELFSTKMKTFSSPGDNKRYGTDIGINVYDLNKKSVDSTLIQDGSGVNQNIFTKYIYQGESNTDVCESDFIVQELKRKLFLRKLKNSKIEVSTSVPVFGLMRGSKLNLEWYDNTNVLDDIISDSELETNVPITGDGGGNMDDEGTYMLNKRLSGQYVVHSTKILFKREMQPGQSIMNMYQTFTLTRIVESGENYANYM